MIAVLVVIVVSATHVWAYMWGYSDARLTERERDIIRRFDACIESLIARKS